MSTRGGKSNQTLEDVGCSPETVNKIVLLGYEKEASLAREFLLRTLDRLNTIYPQEEKDRNRSRKTAEGESLSDLVIRVCGLANVLSGMYIAAKSQQEATKEYLNKVLSTPARNDFQAAIETRYKIRSQSIIIESLERQLKEMEGNGRC